MNIVPLRQITACWLLACSFICWSPAQADTDKGPAHFEVGYAKTDITPPPGLPMWGYGARHDMLADGALSPLYAKAIVIQAGDDKLALVGLDLGRGPTTAMMTDIRERISKQANIDHVLISGTHTHHAPCIELLDREGFGKERFEAAVRYNEELPEKIVEAIVQADSNARPARMGISKKDLTLNRNRHTKRKPKVTDPMLALMRFDDESGEPIAILVNFAAHPVMTDTKILKYSADYPGFLEAKVESELATDCVFMQGASGDLSPNPSQDFREVQAYGEELAEHVVELANATETEVPAEPTVKGVVNQYRFGSRVDFSNPLLTAVYEKAFFPELIRCFLEEVKDGIGAEMNTVLLCNQVAIVGGSGEFFCNHSNRLKERSYVDDTLFFGYCNGHSLYFPTIEAASEGGYGAAPGVSPVELGAGEQMMNQALINIYTMAGKFQPPTVPGANTGSKKN